MAVVTYLDCSSYSQQENKSLHSTLSSPAKGMTDFPVLSATLIS